MALTEVRIPNRQQVLGHIIEINLGDARGFERDIVSRLVSTRSAMGMAGNQGK